MKLVASLMVGPGERDRYLTSVIACLLGFVDEIRVVCESPGEIDGGRSVLVKDAPAGSFFQHEGRARQNLLSWTLDGNPTHILAVDADEIVTDGDAVRRACEQDLGVGIWTLGIQEVWKADAGALWLRSDGGWDMQARAPLLYRAPRKAGGLWRIQDRPLACGREPLAVRQLAGRATRIGADVLHFGWSNKHDRQARYQRYVEHDGGRFHSRAHLDSIMFPDRRVRLGRRDWPDQLAPYKDALLERANRQPVAV